MLFNFGETKCLYTGPANTGMNYELGGTILSETVKETDLGVTMNANNASLTGRRQNVKAANLTWFNAVFALYGFIQNVLTLRRALIGMSPDTHKDQ